jgi:hypothetical protein
LLRKAGSVGRPELLANYLYGIACRTAAKAKSLRGRQQPGHDLRDIEAPATDADWRDLRPLLDEELRNLPEKYRAPLVLCYLEGKTYTEAARALGWPEGTVSGRLARARGLLRGRLVRRGFALSVGSLAVLLARAANAAPLPPAVGEATLKAVAGTVSPRAALLTKGVLHAMFLTKLKTAVAALVAVTLIGTGAGVATHRVLAAQRSGAPAEGVAATVTVAAPAADKDKPKDEGPTATSPDGKQIAAGSDKTIKVFDAQTGRELRSFAGHTDKVTALAYSPDGKLLVSGGADKSVQAWDVATGKLIWKFAGGGAVAAIAFSPDGRTVGAAQADGKNLILDTATGKKME